MVFGQVVIGPPSSGKSTYCEGMRQYLDALGRHVVIINLDPANDVLPYEASADVRELVSVDGVATACELGPNGALVYSLEYLAANLDWLEGVLARDPSAYVLLDMPGQVSPTSQESPSGERSVEGPFLRTAAVSDIAAEDSDAFALPRRWNCIHTTTPCEISSKL
jgi:hypothetical protein